MPFNHLKRRDFITLLGGVAVAWSLAAHAQQPRKLPLVGVLVSASPPHPFADALRRGLQTLGYSEGRNIAPADEEAVGGDEEGIGPVAHEGGKRRLDLAAGAGVEDLDLQSDGACGFRYVS
jgi:putative ABC transport system substrate-binding protein